MCACTHTLARTHARTRAHTEQCTLKTVHQCLRTRAVVWEGTGLLALAGCRYQFNENGCLYTTKAPSLLSVQHSALNYTHLPSTGRVTWLPNSGRMIKPTSETPTKRFSCEKEILFWIIYFRYEFQVKKKVLSHWLCSHYPLNYPLQLGILGIKLEINQLLIIVNKELNWLNK